MIIVTAYFYIYGYDSC